MKTFKIISTLIMSIFLTIAVAQEGSTVSFSSTNADAEGEKRDCFMYGLKAGLNTSTLAGDVSGQEMKTGGQLGWFGIIRISENFGLQPEVLYSLEGTETDVENSEEALNLHYLNVPMLAKIYATDGFFITTGPQLGILLNANDSGFNLTKDRSNPDEDVTGDYHRSTISWEAGLGYQFESGWDFDLRYNAGLSNIVEHPLIGDPRVTGHSVQLSVGYLFNQ